MYAAPIALHRKSSNRQKFRTPGTVIELHVLAVVHQARARARRACALRALGLLLADGTPTVGGGKTF